MICKKCKLEIEQPVRWCGSITMKPEVFPPNIDEIKYCECEFNE